MGVYIGSTPVSLYSGGYKQGTTKFPTALTVTQLPTKKVYQAGEQLDLDGLEVTIIWSDNTTQVVTSQCTFSKNDGDVIYEDTSQIDVYWSWSGLETASYSTSFSITVNKVLTKIEVTNPPNTINYNAGDYLDLTGLVVTATYNSGNTENITESCTYSPSEGDQIYESTTDISILYDTQSTTQPITVTRVLSFISIVSEPTTKVYEKGDTLNLSGLVVKAIYNSGAELNISDYTTSPEENSTLDTLGSVTVTVSYTENSIMKETSFSITVSVKIVTFATGTDAEIEDMINAAHDGLINLEDYWAVGDTRTITLDNKTYNGNAGSMTTSNEQVQLVLAEKLSVNTSYGKSNGFIITTKDCLKNSMKMNSTNTNSGSFSGSAMCQFLNDETNGFLGMLPDWLANVLLTADVKTADPYNGTTISTTQHKIFLPTEREIFGAGYGYSGNGYSNNTEANLAELTQWEYYKTSVNRIKQINGSNNSWWGRSPHYDYDYFFCYVNSNGSTDTGYASNFHGVAPCAVV